MACKVIWAPNAHKSFDLIVSYIEAEWTEREVENFISSVFTKIESLERNPRLGAPLKKNIRRTVINKRMTLNYRHYPRKKEIKLLSFWNTYQDPERQKL